MFREALEHMKGNTLFALLEQLAHAGYVKKEVHPDNLTENDLNDVWEAYYRDPAEAVNLLETMHGFLFEQQELHEFGMGLKDWNRIVAAAKDMLEEQDGEVDAAMERLQSMFTFLPSLEVRRAVEQAKDEMVEGE
jgi:hypothetical protein